MKYYFRNFLIALGLIIAGSSMAQAQSYRSAIGVRVGYPLSITYKKNTSAKNAIEVFGGFRPHKNYNEFRINAALQIHNPISEIKNLRWYYGAGLGLATYSFNNGFVGDTGASVTASGYLGLDYSFEELPINLSVDWVPTLYIGGFGSGFGGGYGALAVRYTL